MGRSVMTLAGADAIAYLSFEPDPSYYSDIYEEDKMDRAQRERDHGLAPVETITSIRRQIWGIEP